MLHNTTYTDPYFCCACSAQRVLKPRSYVIQNLVTPSECKFGWQMLSYDCGKQVAGPISVLRKRGIHILKSHQQKWSAVFFHPFLFG